MILYRKIGGVTEAARYFSDGKMLPEEIVPTITTTKEFLDAAGIVTPPVSQAALELLLNGYARGEGGGLTPLFSVRNPRRCPGYEFLFTCHKTVSIAGTMLSPEMGLAVSAANREAAEICVRLILLASSRSEAVGGAFASHAIALGFGHYWSRSLDPHIHTHQIIPNVSLDSATGRFRNIIPGYPVLQSRQLDAIFNRVLRLGLLRRGVDCSIDRTGRALVPALMPLVEEHSTSVVRLKEFAQKIEESTGERLSPQAISMLNESLRPKKQASKGLPFGALEEYEPKVAIIQRELALEPAPIDRLLAAPRRQIIDSIARAIADSDFDCGSLVTSLTQAYAEGAKMTPVVIRREDIGDTRQAPAQSGDLALAPAAQKKGGASPSGPKAKGQKPQLKEPKERQVAQAVAVSKAAKKRSSQFVRRKLGADILPVAPPPAPRSSIPAATPPTKASVGIGKSSKKRRLGWEILRHKTEWKDPRAFVAISRLKKADPKRAEKKKEKEANNLQKDSMKKRAVFAGKVRTQIAARFQAKKPG